MPQAPASSPNALPNFGDLGRRRPPPPPRNEPRNETVASVVLAAPVAPPSELELDADDILESNDIDSFEAAAAEIERFEVASEPPREPPREPAAEAIAIEALPARTPAPIAVIGRASLTPAPAVAHVQSVSAAPTTTTLVGGMQSPVASHAPVVPPAPHTSPLPLESVIVAGEDDDDANEPIPERTLEMKGAAALVAAATEKLEGSPEHTEVLVRSAMPSALQTQRTSVGLAATTPAWSNGQHSQMQTQRQPAAPRPSSIAPIALDAPVGAPVYPRPTPARSSNNGLLMGGIAFAAVALVAIVGVAGYVASRTLSAKSDAVALSAAAESKPVEVPLAQGAKVEQPALANGTPSALEPAPAADPSPTPSSPGVDVSSLPSAPTPIAAAPAAPVAQGVTAPVAAPPRTTPTGASTSRSSQSSGSRTATQSNAGTALPPPGAGAAAGAPLPPPAAPAPAPVTTVASTGVVRVDPNLRAVVIDGSYYRANDGMVTVTCGRHKVKAGMKDAQVVDVPCGGTVSL